MTALVLRVDASPAIGLGHLARACALGDAATAAGATVELVIGGDPQSSAAFAAGLGYSSIPASINPATDGAELVDRARQLGATIVVDGREAVARLSARLVGRGVTVALVDDIGGAPPADVVINHNHRADALAATYTAPRLLLGRRFSLLRRAVVRRPHGACVPQDRVRPRVAVTLGGSDPVGATARIITALPANPPLDVIAVTGPGYAATAELLASFARASARGHRVERAHAPADLPGLLLTVDAAITAAGGTVGELAYLGVPTCAYAIVDDQRRGATAMAADGLIHGGRSLDSLDAAYLSDDLERFLASHSYRARLRTAALATIDAQGASRVFADITR